MFSNSTSSWLALGIAAVTAGAGLLYARHVGAFAPVSFDLRKLPKGKRFLVKGHRGEYNQATKYFKQLPAQATQVVGIYWDDPRIVGANRCRFSVGVVCGNDSALDQTLREQGGWIETEADADFEAIYCTFPYTGLVSSIVSAIRVYPLWVEEAKKRGKGHGPIVKITDKVKGVMEFYFLTMPPPASFCRSMETIA